MTPIQLQNKMEAIPHIGDAVYVCQIDTRPNGFARLYIVEVVSIAVDKYGFASLAVKSVDGEIHKSVRLENVFESEALAREFLQKMANSHEQ